MNSNFLLNGIWSCALNYKIILSFKIYLFDHESFWIDECDSNLQASHSFMQQWVLIHYPYGTTTHHSPETVEIKLKIFGSNLLERKSLFSRSWRSYRDNSSQASSDQYYQLHARLQWKATKKTELLSVSPICFSTYDFNVRLIFFTHDILCVTTFSSNISMRRWEHKFIIEITWYDAPLT